MRKTVIAGNWKMNKTIDSAVEFVIDLQKLIGDVNDREIVIAPSFTALHAVAKTLENDDKIKLSSQDLFWEESGAFTGEISPNMLKDVGCTHAIIGHSERRQYFGETDQNVNRKVKGALLQQLTPIICIGETLEDREEDRTNLVLETQLVGGIAGLSENEVLSLLIAYEPVWAIGTGKTATPQQAQEVHSFVRSLLAKIYSDEVADRIPILYGGSVKPANVSELMAEPDIDGALVGGASLDPNSFAQLVKF